MKHEQTEELLARRDELSPREKSELEAHLLTCPQCRATATAYERQTNLLRALPMAVPPAALREEVLQRAVPPTRAPVAHARARYASEDKPRKVTPVAAASLWRRDWRVYMLAAPVAAVFLLAAVAIAHFGRQTSSQNAALPTRAPVAPTIVFPTATHAKTTKRATPTIVVQTNNPPVVAAQSTSAPFVAPTAVQAFATSAATAQPTVEVAAVGQKPRPATHGTSGTTGGATSGGPVIAPIPAKPPTPKPTPKPTKIITTGFATPTPAPTPVVAVPGASNATATPAPSPTPTP